MYIFSPSRSGGTLIKNVAEYVLNKKCERHIQIQRPEYSYSVIVYRDHRDIILSRIRVFGDKLIKKNIKSHFNILKNQFNDLNKFAQYLDADFEDRPLLLKYEKFYENFEYLCDKLSIKFQIDLKPNDIEIIQNKFNVESTKKLTDKLGAFDIVDGASGLHGNHIGKHLGAPKIYEYLSIKNQDYITELCKSYLENWHYEL